MSLPEIPINHHVSQPITLSDQVKKAEKNVIERYSTFRVCLSC